MAVRAVTEIQGVSPISAISRLIGVNGVIEILSLIIEDALFPPDSLVS